MCCNPAKGRVEFEDGWLIKSSFITKDEMKACQLTRTKFNQKKKKKYSVSVTNPDQFAETSDLLIGGDEHRDEQVDKSSLVSLLIGSSLKKYYF
jgi:hypothetical protein